MEVGPSSEAWNLIAERVRRAEPFLRMRTVSGRHRNRLRSASPATRCTSAAMLSPVGDVEQQGFRLAARASPSSLRRTSVGT